MESANPNNSAEALTTDHVRRARQGDPQSLDWLIRKFHPLLHAAARYRLGTIRRDRLRREPIGSWFHFRSSGKIAEIWAVVAPVE